MLNLDYEAARAAHSIIHRAAPLATSKTLKSKLENITLKTLGILQEQGMYASSLYLWTRGKSENEFAAILRAELLQFSQRLLGLPSAPNVAADAASYLNFVSEQLTKDLTAMLWMKDAWELALIYARYGAKTVKL